MQCLFVITLLLGLTAASPPLPRRDMEPRAGTMIKSWALSQFHLLPFNLIDMGVECTKNNANSSLYGCSIQCKSREPRYPSSQGPQNNYSTDYFFCKNDNIEIFQFKFVDVFDLSNFSLSLTHIYKDNRNFPTPTIANMFSQPNITLDLLSKSNTTMMYSSGRDGPIKANITGMTI